MNYYKHIILSSLGAIALVSSFCTSAKTLTQINYGITPQQAMLRMAKPANVYESQRYNIIRETNSRMMAKAMGETADQGASGDGINPVHSFGPTRMFYDVDGPNGQLWYCTSELSCREIEHQYYTEYILTEYSFSLYDADFNLVGTIHDKMRYQDDEVRVPGPDNGISILPIITKNYFNSDDKYEIVVSLAVNSVTPGVNHYRSVVYSIGGEKETVSIERDGQEVEVVVDKPVTQLNAFVSDVLDASTATEEKIYMTFMSDFGTYPDIDFDKLIDGDEEEGKKYWDAVANNGYTFNLYGKADAEGNLVKVFEKTVTYQTIQGDQESSPVMLTFMHNDEPYVLVPHYKETFFNPYYSPFEDMSMREGNSFVIDLYKINGNESSLAYTCEIPIYKAEGSDILATYYSVGDLRYSSDITFDEENKPQFLITRCNYTTGSDDTSGYYFYIYDCEGNKKVDIFENAERSLALTNISGLPDQAVFVRYDEDEGYLYNFVNLDSGYKNHLVKINYLLDTGYDEPEMLVFNVDRVALNNGTYKYAFEMREPLVDEDDNNYIRVAWFNSDGSFDRIDHMNIGSAVNYATVYINGTALNPTFIKSDETPDYMVLIKRGLSSLDSSSQEELMIVQPVDEDFTGGNTILHLTPCEKGTLSSIYVYNGDFVNKNSLFIGYSGDNGYTADFYELPFADSFIENVTPDSANTHITYDGSTLLAPGLAIKVYNTYGAEVAAGNSALDVTSLSAGIYIAKAGGSVAKFVVK